MTEGMTVSEERKAQLAKRIYEISGEGILLDSGIVFHSYDKSISGTVMDNSIKNITKGRASPSQVICVLDDTIGRSGKSGFVFTDTAIYCRCFINTDSDFYIEYEDIDFTAYDDSGDDIILKIYSKYREEPYKINHPWFSKKKIMWFIDEAVELVKQDDELVW